MIAGVTFLTLLATAGVRATPGVLIVPLEREFGWSLRDDLASDLGQPAPLRPDRPVRGRAHGADRSPSSDARLAGDGRDGRGLFGLDDHPLAAHPALGRDRRRWHGHDGDGTRGDGGQPMVRRAGAGAGRPDGELRDRPDGVPSCPGGDRRVARLAPAVLVVAGTAFLLVPLVALLCATGPRTSGSPRWEPLWESRGVRAGVERPVAAALAALATVFTLGTSRLLAGSFFICGLSTNGLIGTASDPACMDAGIPEVRAAGLLAAMGLFDLVGDHRLGLAVRPVRQPGPALLVLRLAGAVTGLPALRPR